MWGGAIKSEKSKNILDENYDVGVGNSLVLWVTIESLNDKNYFGELLKDIVQLSKRFNTKVVVLTPFVHLTNKPLNQKQSLVIIKALEKYLGEKGFGVKKAHFGSAKDLKMSSPADKYQVVYRSYPKPIFVRIPSQTLLKQK